LGDGRAASASGKRRAQQRPFTSKIFKSNKPIITANIIRLSKSFPRVAFARVRNRGGPTAPSREAMPLEENE
jgi:hypothetical protein